MTKAVDFRSRSDDELTDAIATRFVVRPGEELAP